MEKGLKKFRKKTVFKYVLIFTLCLLLGCVGIVESFSDFINDFIIGCIVGASFVAAAGITAIGSPIACLVVGLVYGIFELEDSTDDEDSGGYSNPRIEIECDCGEQDIHHPGDRIELNLRTFDFNTIPDTYVWRLEEYNQNYCVWDDDGCEFDDNDRVWLESGGSNRGNTYSAYTTIIDVVSKSTLLNDLGKDNCYLNVTVEALDDNGDIIASSDPYRVDIIKPGTTIPLAITQVYLKASEETPVDVYDEMDEYFTGLHTIPSGDDAGNMILNLIWSDALYPPVVASKTRVENRLGKVAANENAANATEKYLLNKLTLVYKFNRQLISSDPELTPFAAAINSVNPKSSDGTDATHIEKPNGAIVNNVIFVTYLLNQQVTDAVKKSGVLIDMPSLGYNSQPKIYFYVREGKDVDIEIKATKSFLNTYVEAQSGVPAHWEANTANREIIEKGKKYSQIVWGLAGLNLRFEPTIEDETPIEAYNYSLLVNHPRYGSDTPVWDRERARANAEFQQAILNEKSDNKINVYYVPFKSLYWKSDNIFSLGTNIVEKYPDGPDYTSARVKIIMPTDHFPLVLAHELGHMLLYDGYLPSNQGCGNEHKKFTFVSGAFGCANAYWPARNIMYFGSTSDIKTSMDFLPASYLQVLELEKIFGKTVKNIMEYKNIDLSKGFVEQVLENSILTDAQIERVRYYYNNNLYQF